MTLTVLVVDDDDWLRALTVDAVTLLGLEVVDCASADDALLILKGQPAIALVITDICMPGRMDGFELATVIWTRWPWLPVILTSGNRYVAVESLPAHALFIRKPWSLDALHEAVGKHLPV
ncbi:response regulator [Pseudomonas siliginis]|uniref:response regulator n=1 Tax=Pseudomonas siliginis TaxID=2842346 RepID=UPI003867A54E